ncbi:hypothetical protein TNCV_4030351 [Trichonephila clavipes]|nr:hypothetical protein TNCV_4030351 [Trichonephila clavipes]
MIESVEEGERKVDIAKTFEIPLSSPSTILKNKEKIFSASSSRVRKRVNKALIIIDKAWRAVTPLTIHSFFKKSGFPRRIWLMGTIHSLNLMLKHPFFWEALPEQDLTFDDYMLVGMDIAVWGAVSNAEIVALNHNNTESDEDESEELTPVTLPEA